MAECVLLHVWLDGVDGFRHFIVDYLQTQREQPAASLQVSDFGVVFNLLTRRGQVVKIELR